MILFLSAIGCIGGGATDDTGSTLPDCPDRELAMSPELEEVVQGNNAFAFDLYQELGAAEGNLFLSPLSVSAALGMTLGGAEANTEVEMLSALRVGDEALFHENFGRQLRELNAMDTEDCGVELAVANRLWGQVDYPWEPDFLDLTATAYDAPFAEVDYITDYEGARQEINAWVEEQTNDRIQDLLPQGVLNDGTRLVLTNAIYFKAAWLEAFDPEDTRTGTWRPTGDDVELMTMTGAEFPVAWGDTYTALKLPYNGENQSMIIVLPQDEDGLDALEASLDAESFEAIVDSMEVQTLDELWLPRWTMEYEASLVPPMMALGMVDAFSEVDADLTAMADTPEHLFVTEIRHKAFLEVNEAGSEAAAATAVVVGTESAGPMFLADHPFFFVIRDELTGSLLFMGRLEDPGA